MAGKSATDTHRCCILFSLDTGVKILAALMFIVCIAHSVNIILNPDALTLGLPLAVMYGLTFIFFAYALNKQSVMNRHILWAAYTLLILIGGRSILFHYIWEEKFFDVRHCDSSNTYEECRDN